MIYHVPQIDLHHCSGRPGAFCMDGDQVHVHLVQPLG